MEIHKQQHVSGGKCSTFSLRHVVWPGLNCPRALEVACAGGSWVVRDLRARARAESEPLAYCKAQSARGCDWGGGRNGSPDFRQQAGRASPRMGSGGPQAAGRRNRPGSHRAARVALPPALKPRREGSKTRSWFGDQEVTGDTAHFPSMWAAGRCGTPHGQCSGTSSLLGGWGPAKGTGRCWVAHWLLGAVQSPACIKAWKLHVLHLRSVREEHWYERDGTRISVVGYKRVLNFIFPVDFGFRGILSWDFLSPDLQAHLAAPRFVSRKGCQRESSGSQTTQRTRCSRGQCSQVGTHSWGPQPAQSWEESRPSVTPRATMPSSPSNWYTSPRPPRLEGHRHCPVHPWPTPSPQPGTWRGGAGRRLGQEVHKGRRTHGQYQPQCPSPPPRLRGSLASVGGTECPADRGALTAMAEPKPRPVVGRKCSQTQPETHILHF